MTQHWQKLLYRTLIILKKTLFIGDAQHKQHSSKKSNMNRLNKNILNQINYPCLHYWAKINLKK